MIKKKIEWKKKRWKYVGRRPDSIQQNIILPVVWMNRPHVTHFEWFLIAQSLHGWLNWIMISSASELNGGSFKRPCDCDALLTRPLSRFVCLMRKELICILELINCLDFENDSIRKSRWRSPPSVQQSATDTTCGDHVVLISLHNFKGKYFRSAACVWMFGIPRKTSRCVCVYMFRCRVFIFHAL